MPVEIVMAALSLNVVKTLLLHSTKQASCMMYHIFLMRPSKVCFNVHMVQWLQAIQIVEVCYTACPSVTFAMTTPSSCFSEVVLWAWTFVHTFCHRPVLKVIQMRPSMIVFRMCFISVNLLEIGDKSHSVVILMVASRRNIYRLD